MIYCDSVINNYKMTFSLNLLGITNNTEHCDVQIDLVPAAAHFDAAPVGLQQIFSKKKKKDQPVLWMSGNVVISS